MLPIVIAVIIVAMLAVWGIYTQRRLVVLDENIRNTMSQIGMQLSSRFDALTALLNMAKGYAQHESEALIEIIKSGRSEITARSTPHDVLLQEDIISEVWGRITIVTGQYPELKADQYYAKTMDAVEVFDNIVRTSRLLYNDSVTKLNREIRLFPVSMIAGILGFRTKEYLKTQTVKADNAME